MIVWVLVSAAGGGVPQWNCACANCSAARAETQPRRSSSCFAVSGDGVRWWLVNVSPDIAQQVEAYPPLQPRAGRGTPIVGMLLTDANVDLGGFAVLRQDGDHAFAVFSSATVRAIATEQPAFATFAHPPHTWRAIGAHEEIDLDGWLRLPVVLVDGPTPGMPAGARSRTPWSRISRPIATRMRRRCSRRSFRTSGRTCSRRRDADLAFFDGSF
jgi:pyrroloquinoline quinone biosynthesis protein B